MEAVLLGRGADRQYRGGAVADAPRNVVPHHALDKIAFGISAHASGLLYSVETLVRIPEVIQPCR